MEKQAMDSEEHQYPVSVTFENSQTIGKNQTYGAETVTGENISINNKAKDENLHSVATGILDKPEGEVFVEAPPRDQIPFSDDSDSDLHEDSSVEEKKEVLESGILVQKEKDDEVEEEKDENIKIDMSNEHTINAFCHNQATECDLALSEKMHENERTENSCADQVQKFETLGDQAEDMKQENSIACENKQQDFEAVDNTMADKEPVYISAVTKEKGPENIDTSEITENEELAKEEWAPVSQRDIDILTELEVPIFEGDLVNTKYEEGTSSLQNEENSLQSKDTIQVIEVDEVENENDKLEDSRGEKLEEACKVAESDNAIYDIPRAMSVDEPNSVATTKDNIVKDQEITYTRSENENVVQKEEENDVSNFNASPHSQLMNQIEDTTAQELQETPEVVQNKDHWQEKEICQDEIKPCSVKSDMQMQLLQAQNVEVDDQDEAIEKDIQMNQNENYDMDASSELSGQMFLCEEKKKDRSKKMIGFGDETNEAEARMNMDEEEKRSKEHNEANEMKQGNQTSQENMQIETYHGTLTKHAPDDVLEANECKENLETSTIDVMEKIIMSDVGASMEKEAAEKEPSKKTEVPPEEIEEVVTAEKLATRTSTEEPSNTPDYEYDKIPEMVDTYNDTETANKDDLKKDVKDIPISKASSLRKAYNPVIREHEETPICVTEELIDQKTTTKDDMDIDTYKGNTEAEKLALISNTMNEDQNDKSEEISNDTSIEDYKPQDEEGMQKNVGDIPEKVCKKQEDSSSVAEEQINQIKDTDDDKKDDAKKENMESEKLDIVPDLVHENQMQPPESETEAKEAHCFTNGDNLNNMASEIHNVNNDQEITKSENDSVLEEKMDENSSKNELVMDSLIQKNERAGSDKNVDTLISMIGETAQTTNEMHGDDRNKVCQNMELIQQDHMSENVEEIHRTFTGEKNHEAFADIETTSSVNLQDIASMDEVVGSLSSTQNPLEVDTQGSANPEESNENIYDKEFLQVSLEDSHETTETNKRMKATISTDEWTNMLMIGVISTDDQKEGEELTKEDELKQGEETIIEDTVSTSSLPNTAEQSFDDVLEDDKSEEEHGNTKDEIFDTTILTEINPSTTKLVEGKDHPEEQEKSFQEMIDIFKLQEEALVGTGLADASSNTENEDAKDEEGMQKNDGDLPDTVCKKQEDSNSVAEDYDKKDDAKKENMESEKPEIVPDLVHKNQMQQSVSESEAKEAYSFTNGDNLNNMEIHNVNNDPETAKSENDSILEEKVDENSSKNELVMDSLIQENEQADSDENVNTLLMPRKMTGETVRTTNQIAGDDRNEVCGNMELLEQDPMSDNVEEIHRTFSGEQNHKAFADIETVSSVNLQDIVSMDELVGCSSSAQNPMEEDTQGTANLEESNENIYDKRFLQVALEDSNEATEDNKRMEAIVSTDERTNMITIGVSSTEDQKEGEEITKEDKLKKGEETIPEDIVSTISLPHTSEQSLDDVLENDKSEEEHENTKAEVLDTAILTEINPSTTELAEGKDLPQEQEKSFQEMTDISTPQEEALVGNSIADACSNTENEDAKEVYDLVIREPEETPSCVTEELINQTTTTKDNMDIDTHKGSTDAQKLAFISNTMNQDQSDKSEEISIDTSIEDYKPQDEEGMQKNIGDIPDTACKKQEDFTNSVSEEQINQTKDTDDNDKGDAKRENLESEKLDIVPDLVHENKMCESDVKDAHSYTNDDGLKNMASEIHDIEQETAESKNDSVLEGKMDENSGKDELVMDSHIQKNEQAFNLDKNVDTLLMSREMIEETVQITNEMHEDDEIEMCGNMVLIEQDPTSENVEEIHRTFSGEQNHEAIADVETVNYDNLQDTVSINEVVGSSSSTQNPPEEDIQGASSPEESDENKYDKGFLEVALEDPHEATEANRIVEGIVSRDEQTNMITIGVSSTEDQKEGEDHNKEDELKQGEETIIEDIVCTISLPNTAEKSLDGVLENNKCEKEHENNKAEVLETTILTEINASTRELVEGKDLPDEQEKSFQEMTEIATPQEEALVGTTIAKVSSTTENEDTKVSDVVHVNIDIERTRENDKDINSSISCVPETDKLVAEHIHAVSYNHQVVLDSGCKEQIEEASHIKDSQVADDNIEEVCQKLESVMELEYKYKSQEETSEIMSQNSEDNANLISELIDTSETIENEESAKRGQSQVRWSDIDNLADIEVPIIQKNQVTTENVEGACSIQHEENTLQTEDVIQDSNLDKGENEKDFIGDSHEEESLEGVCQVEDSVNIRNDIPRAVTVAESHSILLPIADEKTVQDQEVRRTRNEKKIVIQKEEESDIRNLNAPDSQPPEQVYSIIEERNSENLQEAFEVVQIKDHCQEKVALDEMEFYNVKPDMQIFKAQNEEVNDQDEADDKYMQINQNERHNAEISYEVLFQQVIYEEKQQNRSKKMIVLEDEKGEAEARMNLDEEQDNNKKHNEGNELKQGKQDSEENMNLLTRQGTPTKQTLDDALEKDDSKDNIEISSIEAPEEIIRYEIGASAEEDVAAAEKEHPERSELPQQEAEAVLTPKRAVARICTEDPSSIPDYEEEKIPEVVNINDNTAIAKVKDEDNLEKNVEVTPTSDTKVLQSIHDPVVSEPEQPLSSVVEELIHQTTTTKDNTDIDVYKENIEDEKLFISISVHKDGNGESEETEVDNSRNDDKTQDEEGIEKNISDIPEMVREKQEIISNVVMEDQINQTDDTKDYMKEDANKENMGSEKLEILPESILENQIPQSASESEVKKPHNITNDENLSNMVSEIHDMNNDQETAKANDDSSLENKMDVDTNNNEMAVDTIIQKHEQALNMDKNVGILLVPTKTIEGIVQIRNEMHEDDQDTVSENKELITKGPVHKNVEDISEAFSEPKHEAIDDTEIIISVNSQDNVSMDRVVGSSSSIQTLLEGNTRKASSPEESYKNIHDEINENTGVLDKSHGADQMGAHETTEAKKIMEGIDTVNEQTNKIATEGTSVEEQKENEELNRQNELTQEEETIKEDMDSENSLENTTEKSPENVLENDKSTKENENTKAEALMSTIMVEVNVLARELPEGNDPPKQQKESFQEIAEICVPQEEAQVGPNIADLSNNPDNEDAKNEDDQNVTNKHEDSRNDTFSDTPTKSILTNKAASPEEGETMGNQNIKQEASSDLDSTQGISEAIIEIDPAQVEMANNDDCRITQKIECEAVHRELKEHISKIDESSPKISAPDEETKQKQEEEEEEEHEISLNYQEQTEKGKTEDDNVNIGALEGQKTLEEIESAATSSTEQSVKPKECDEEETCNLDLLSDGDLRHEAVDVNKSLKDILEQGIEAKVATSRTDMQTKTEENNEMNVLVYEGKLERRKEEEEEEEEAPIREKASDACTERPANLVHMGPVLAATSECVAEKTPEEKKAVKGIGNKVKDTDSSEYRNSETTTVKDLIEAKLSCDEKKSDLTEDSLCTKEVSDTNTMQGNAAEVTSKDHNNALTEDNETKETALLENEDKEKQEGENYLLSNKLTNEQEEDINYLNSSVVKDSGEMYTNECIEESTQKKKTEERVSQDGGMKDMTIENVLNIFDAMDKMNKEDKLPLDAENNEENEVETRLEPKEGEDENHREDNNMKPEEIVYETSNKYIEENPKEEAIGERVSENQKLEDVEAKNSVNAIPAEPKSILTNKAASPEEGQRETVPKEDETMGNQNIKQEASSYLDSTQRNSEAIIEIDPAQLETANNDDCRITQKIECEAVHKELEEHISKIDESSPKISAPDEETKQKQEEEEEEHEISLKYQEQTEKGITKDDVVNIDALEGQKTLEEIESAATSSTEQSVKPKECDEEETCNLDLLYDGVLRHEAVDVNKSLKDILEQGIEANVATSRTDMQTKTEEYNEMNVLVCEGKLERKKEEEEEEAPIREKASDACTERPANLVQMGPVLAATSERVAEKTPEEKKAVKGIGNKVKDTDSSEYRNSETTTVKDLIEAKLSCDEKKSDLTEDSLCTKEVSDTNTMQGNAAEVTSKDHNNALTEDNETKETALFENEDKEKQEGENYLLSNKLTNEQEEDINYLNSSVVKDSGEMYTNECIEESTQKKKTEERVSQDGGMRDMKIENALNIFDAMDKMNKEDKLPLDAENNEENEVETRLEPKEGEDENHREDNNMKPEEIVYETSNKYIEENPKEEAIGERVSENQKLEDVEANNSVNAIPAEPKSILTNKAASPEEGQRETVPKEDETMGNQNIKQEASSYLDSTQRNSEAIIEIDPAQLETANNDDCRITQKIECEAVHKELEEHISKIDESSPKISAPDEKTKEEQEEEEEENEISLNYQEQTEKGITKDDIVNIDALEGQKTLEEIESAATSSTEQSVKPKECDEEETCNLDLLSDGDLRHEAVDVNKSLKDILEQGIEANVATSRTDMQTKTEENNEMNVLVCEGKLERKKEEEEEEAPIREKASDACTERPANLVHMGPVLAARSERVAEKTPEEKKAVKGIGNKVKDTDSSEYRNSETTTVKDLIEAKLSCDEKKSDLTEDSLCTKEVSDINTMQGNAAEVTSKDHNNASTEDNETKETALLENEDKEKQEGENYLLSNKLTNDQEEDINYLNSSEVKDSGEIYTNECIEDSTQEKKTEERVSQDGRMKDMKIENALNIFDAMDKMNKEDKLPLDAENNEENEVETRLEPKEGEDENHREDNNMKPEEIVYETSNKYIEENPKEEAIGERVSVNQKLEDVKAKNSVYAIPAELEVVHKDTYTDKEYQGRQLIGVDLEENFQKTKDKVLEVIVEVGPFTPTNEQIHASNATDDISPQNQILKIVDSDVTIEDNHSRMVGDSSINTEFVEEIKDEARSLPQLETSDLQSLQETESYDHFVSQDVTRSDQNETSDLNSQNNSSEVMQIKQQPDQLIGRLEIADSNEKIEHIIAKEDLVQAPDVSGVRNAAHEHFQENDYEVKDVEPKSMLEDNKSITLSNETQKNMINESDNISSDQDLIIVDLSEKIGTASELDEEERKDHNSSFVIIGSDGEVMKYVDKDLDRVSDSFTRESSEEDIKTHAMHVEAENEVGRSVMTSDINEAGEEFPDETSLSLLPAEDSGSIDQEDQVKLQENLNSVSNKCISKENNLSVEFTENKELFGNFSTTQATDESKLEEQKERLEQAEGPHQEVADLNRSKCEEQIDLDDLPVSHSTEQILKSKCDKLDGVEPEVKVEENICDDNHDNSISEQEYNSLSLSIEKVREDTSTLEAEVGKKLEDTSDMMPEYSHDNIIGKNSDESFIKDDESPVERNTNDNSSVSGVDRDVPNEGCHLSAEVPTDIVSGNKMELSSLTDIEEFSKADYVQDDEKIQASILGKSTAIPKYEGNKNLKNDILPKEGGEEEIRSLHGVEKVDRASIVLLEKLSPFTSEPDKDEKVLDKSEESLRQYDEIGDSKSLIIEDNTVQEAPKIQSKGMEVEASKNNQDAITELQMQNEKSDLIEAYMTSDSHKVQQSDAFVKSTAEVFQIEGKVMEELSPKILMDERQINKTTETHLDEDKTDEENDDEHRIVESGHDSTMTVESRDADFKPAHKKSHNILSGVGSKVKRSIAKVKKVITGKSSHSKTVSSLKKECIS